jgi:dTDP-4-amino-4,6-dideoxygalactose transaminase
MKVDFYSTKDLPKSLKKDFARIFLKSLNQDSLIEGNACRIFEQKFGEYLEIEHVIGVGNGFDALKIGLQAMGVTEGDRVAVPAHTFIATWYAIQSIGATPVGIDVTVDGQIDLDLLENESGLKAVIPVHMHGSHCDMKRLTTWAKINNVKVLEDCAQAAGLDIQGKKAGTWGDVSAFSFYPTKNLFALGDGGAITTKNSAYREKARELSRYGSDINNKYIHNSLGQNSRLDTIQAGFLSHGLTFLDEWNNYRKDIANRYNENFYGLGISPKLSNESVYHHYFILLKERDDFRSQLSRLNVSTEMHYPMVAGIEAKGDEMVHFPVSSIIARETLSLPISPWQTSKETNYVIDSVQKIISMKQQKGD